MVQFAIFVIEFPDACTFSLFVIALVKGYSIVVIDDVRAILLPIDEVGFNLDVAVWEIEYDTSIADVVGQTFGATDSVVAVELDDILVYAGAEHDGAWGAEHAQVVDIYRVEYAVIVRPSVTVVEYPVATVFVVLGKVAGGKELAIVEIVIPCAVGYLGFAGECFLELQLAVLVKHLFPDTCGVFFVAFLKEYYHGFSVGVALYDFLSYGVARCGEQCCGKDEEKAWIVVSVLHVTE